MLYYLATTAGVGTRSAAATYAFAAMNRSITVFRIIELESGNSVDITVRDLAVQSFCEQLARGVKKPKNRVAFLKRLQYRIEEAIEESLDPSLQPPRTGEETEAAFRAMMQNLRVPAEAFRRRTVMLKFLRDNPRDLSIDDSQAPSDGEHSSIEGET